VIFAPVALFLVAVLIVWTIRPSATASAPPRLALIGGLVGLVSVAATAYLVHDRSQKVASVSALAHTNNLAVALLVAHGALFFALLLKKN
jgi:hypothetical protein